VNLSRVSDLPPDPHDHPRRLLGAAVARFGRDVVVRWCEELLAGRATLDDDRFPRIEWLGGNERWKDYWARTWGARGLLHVGPPERSDVVVAALGDEHWRVREMALKVTRAHGLDVPEGVLEALLDDDNARVRAAAAAALAAERDAPGP
jgi:HEAT repeat protein